MLAHHSTETMKVGGTAFDKGSVVYYDMIYDYLVNGKEMKAYKEL